MAALSLTPEEWQGRLQQAMQAGDLDTANKIRFGLGMPAIDASTGASFNQRSAVQDSQGPGAQAQAAGNFGYSQPFGSDNYMNPQGQLFNPPGLDLGDAAAVMRPLAETGGVLLGGFAGTPGGIPGMMAGASLGGTSAGMTYDQIMNRDGRVDTRDLGDTAKDTAMSALFDAPGAPQAPGIDASGMLLRGARVPGTPVSVSEAAQAVSDRGGTTTPGMRGPGASRYFEGALESSPFAGPTMNRNRAQTVDIFGDIINDATPKATSRDAAGDAMVKGYDYSKDWAQANVQNAYHDFDTLIDRAGESRTSRVPADSLKLLSDEYKMLLNRDEKFASMVFQDPDLKGALDAIDSMGQNVQRNAADPSLALPEAPTYDILKRLRTMIGKKIDFQSPGSEQVGLKSLYRTLSDDLAQGAESLGGPEALAASQRADKMFSQLQTDLKAVDPVFKYAQNPTQVYSALDRALRNDPALAARAKDAMGPNQWETFVDSWLRLNTRATKGGQDITGQIASPHVAASALADLKRSSPEGYQLLTAGKEEAFGVIDQLAQMLRQSEQYINRSRTSNAVGATMFGGDLLSAATAGGIGLAAGHGPTLPAVAAATGLVARPIISKLMAATLTSKTLNNALIKMGRSSRDGIPNNPADFARALVAAGADSKEVNDIFNTTVNEDIPSLFNDNRPPVNVSQPMPDRSAGNAVPY